MTDTTSMNLLVCRLSSVPSHLPISYLKAVPTQAYASSFRAPLINSKWKTVDSTQLKDVISLLTDVFPELNLQEPLIIFCTTRVATNVLHKQLVDSIGSQNGAVFKLHGAMPQSERQQAIKGFESQAGLILVATHLAALGLNLTRRHQVLNIGVPHNLNSYIQACGRAARSGKDVATIRTAILKRNIPTFTQYQRWHMLDRQNDNDETGLWLNDDKYEGGNEDYMVSDALVKVMRKLALSN
ncbi:hypothetical protein KCU93_g2022, partial [Aureobasidium melanogenum]